jgi:hypothetical protein
MGEWWRSTDRTDNSKGSRMNREEIFPFFQAVHSSDLTRMKPRRNDRYGKSNSFNFNLRINKAEFQPVLLFPQAPVTLNLSLSVISREKFLITLFYIHASFPVRIHEASIYYSPYQC